MREAASKGANIILLQELFETPYFCQEQKAKYYDLAKPYEDNQLIARRAGIGLSGAQDYNQGQFRITALKLSQSAADALLSGAGLPSLPKSSTSCCQVSPVIASQKERRVIQGAYHRLSMRVM